MLKITNKSSSLFYPPTKETDVTHHKRRMKLKGTRVVIRHCKDFCKPTVDADYKTLVLVNIARWPSLEIVLLKVSGIKCFKFGCFLYFSVHVVAGTSKNYHEETVVADVPPTPLHPSNVQVFHEVN